MLSWREKIKHAKPVMSEEGLLTQRHVARRLTWIFFPADKRLVEVASYLCLESVFAEHTVEYERSREGAARF
jgi:hypothetical protein